MRTNLVLADSFDGSMGLRCLTTDIRVVCANTMAVAVAKDGNEGMVIRHTESLEMKVNKLAASIVLAIKHGEKVREAYKQAESIKLGRAANLALFDALFPEADKDATPIQRTKAENFRRDAKIAANLPINRVASSGLATAWNAATYLVDRHADGTARPPRSGDALDSLLFGARAQRIQEIQTIIEVVMRDGTVQPMAAPQAVAIGVDPRLVGKAMLADMLDQT